MGGNVAELISKDRCSFPQTVEYVFKVGSNNPPDDWSRVDLLKLQHNTPAHKDRR